MKTIAFIIGLGAVFLYLLCYQFRRRGAIIACSIASRVLYVTQYLLLGAWMGAAMDLSAIPSSMLAARKQLPFVAKHKLLFWLFANGVILVIGLLVWENAFSVIPLIGVLLETNALWLTREKHIRLLSLACVPFWLTYNVMSGAWGSAIGSVLAAVSILSAIYRYDRGAEKSAQTEK